MQLLPSRHKITYLPSSFVRFVSFVVNSKSVFFEWEGSKQEIYDFIKVDKINFGLTQLVVIVKNRCIETWFLGNKRIYSRQPQSQPLLNYTKYYNVATNYPELMGKYKDFNTHAQFHEVYLKELFRAKNINYSKNNPGDVMKLYYLEQLLYRINENQHHLLTFQDFVTFCDLIKSRLIP